MFSLDQWVATPPLSALFSLLLIAGLDRLGLWVLRLLGFEVGSHKAWVRWQAPMVGAMLLAIVLYPLALAGLTPLKLMQGIAIACMGCGLWQLFQVTSLAHGRGETLSAYWSVAKAQSCSRKLLLVMLLGMGLLALGPVTNADALDYHIGVAIAVLNHGGMPVAPEWFIGRLAGNGEVLNALALSVGAEQFGSLLQYVSLLGIVGIILFASRGVHAQADTQEQAASDLIALAAFSVPILLFLISAPKPQMWPIAMTTFAFALVVHPSRRNLSRCGALIGFALVCALLMTASQAKFNYLLGGGVVGLFALWGMTRQRLLMVSVGVGLVAVAMVVAPALVWKSIAFHASWVDVLTHPLPGHLPGTDAFVALAKGASDMTSPLPFPWLMLIPTSVGAFSTLLGLGALVFIGLRLGRDVWLWAGAGAAFFMVLASAVLAPPSARMYLEPYYWLLIILVLQPNRQVVMRYGVVRWIVLGQALAVTAVCWLGALTLLPGAFTASWRSAVMQRAANGYEVMQWADTVLPKNAVVLNGHRSMALMPRDVVAYDWSNFVHLASVESTPYLLRMKDRGVSHMLVVGAVNPSLPLYKCFGAVLAGPGLGHLATRNPFNQGGHYEAWIVEFESARLPECAQHASP
jgi:hypothetical protein